MSPQREAGERGGRRGVPAVWRRGMLATLLAGLVAGNAWLIRKQYPPDEQQRNEAYDRALRAFDVERDYKKAELEFRRYLAIADEPRVRVLLAVCLQIQGRTDEAANEFRAALERNPSDDHARLGLAEIARGAQDYDEAFRQLAAAEAEQPTPVDVTLLRARTLSEVGDVDGAIATYRKALERDPGSYDAHLEIADLLVFRALMTGREDERQGAAGSYRAAEDLIKSRLGRADDRRLRLALARAIAGQVVTLKDRNLEEAIRQLREVADGDPTDPEPTLLLGKFLHAAGDDVEARRTFEDVAKRWPRPDTAIALHEFYGVTKQPELARKALEDAIGRDRENLVLRVRLVAWCALNGQIDDAEAELASAEKILSGDWRVREVRGDLARLRSRQALGQGNKDDAEAQRVVALAAYRDALAARPNSPRLKKKVAGQLIDGMLARRGATGGAASAEGSPEAADEAFARRCIDDVLRVNRTDPEALEWQARLLLAEGRPREVAELLRPQLDAAQPSIGALRLLGAAAGRTGDETTAAAAWIRVLDILSPRDAAERRDARRAPPEDWCSAAHACIRAGRFDEASRLCREALSAWPESSRVVAAGAAAALARQDLTGALAILADARTRFPRDGEVRLLYARALEASGRVDDAGRELEAAIADIGSDEARVRYLDFLGRNGRLEGAEQGFLQMVAADPTSSIGHLRLGDFYLAGKTPRRDAALREYELARDLAPRDPEAWIRIADLRLEESKDDSQAFARAEEATAAFEERAPGDPRIDYLRGKIAILSGQNDEALVRLRRFAAAQPDLAAAHYYLGLTLRAMGRPEDALEPMERATRLAPGDAAMRLQLAQLHYDLGVKAFQKDDYEAARQLFGRADAGGGAQGSRLLMAGAAANSGKFDVGESECRKLLASEPDNRAASHLLAMLLLRKNTKESLDESELLFRRVLAAEPDDLLAGLGVATVKFAKGLPKEALADYMRLYPRTKSSPDVALAICQCHAAAADLQGAVDFLDVEAAANPAAWDFPHLKGDFLVNLKQWDAAVASYLEASRRAPDRSGPVLAAASALASAGRLEDARKLLVERQAGSKDQAMFAVALGDVLAHMNRPGEAQDECRRALSLAPGHPRALFLLGRVAEMGGRGAEARKLYREASDRGIVDPDCHARLAHFLAADRDFAGAREAWLRALQFAPRNPTYMNNLALVTAEDPNRLEEAIRYAQSASALAPERGEIADTYGWLLYAAGRTKEAATMLARAATLLPQVAVVQFHAGMALSREGRAPEARSHLERALRLDAKFDGADTARAEIERLR